MVQILKNKMTEVIRLAKKVDPPFAEILLRVAESQDKSFDLDAQPVESYTGQNKGWKKASNVNYEVMQQKAIDEKKNVVTQVVAARTYAKAEPVPIREFPPIDHAAEEAAKADMTDEIDFDSMDDDMVFAHFNGDTGLLKYLQGKGVDVDEKFSADNLMIEFRRLQRNV